MRICFDRLCFTTKRPADDTSTDDTPPPGSTNYKNHKNSQKKVNDTRSKFTLNNNFKNSTNKNGSINALDPPIIKQPTTSQQSLNLENIGRTLTDHRSLKDDYNDHSKFGAYENSLKISDSDSILDYTKFSTSTSSANNKLRKIDLETEETDYDTSDKMQQEPNANFQYQPELLLNNNVPSQTASDLLTQSLIFGTIPPNGDAQGLLNDPNLQLNILEEQQLQLQRRYQHLQALLNPEKKVLFTPTPSPTSPTNPITAQMQELCLATEQSNYAPSTPQEERLLQVIKGKDLRIQELQRVLQSKENEIAELKSHLDKFQSVFPFSRSQSGGRATGQSFQRQRAQGISAEPQSEKKILELLHVTFPKYDKEEG